MGFLIATYVALGIVVCVNVLLGTWGAAMFAKGSRFEALFHDIFLIILSTRLCLVALGLSLIGLACWLRERTLIWLHLINLGLAVVFFYGSFLTFAWIPAVGRASERREIRGIINATAKPSPEIIERALRVALRNGDNSIIRLLIDRLGDEPTSDVGLTQVLYFLMFNTPADDENIQHVLSKRPNLNVEIWWFHHPMHAAIVHGNLEHVQMLLEAGFNPRLRSRSGSDHAAAFVDAVEHQQHEILRYFVQNGMNWLLDGAVEPKSPMAIAIVKKDIESIQILLDGAPVRQLNELPDDLKEQLGVLLFKTGDPVITKIFTDRGFPPEMVNGN